MSTYNDYRSPMEDILQERKDKLIRQYEDVDTSEIDGASLRELRGIQQELAEIQERKRARLAERQAKAEAEQAAKDEVQRRLRAEADQEQELRAQMELIREQAEANRLAKIRAKYVARDDVQALFDHLLIVANREEKYENDHRYAIQDEWKRLFGCDAPPLDMWRPVGAAKNPEHWVIDLSDNLRFDCRVNDTYGVTIQPRILSARGIPVVDLSAFNGAMNPLTFGNVAGVAKPARSKPAGIELARDILKGAI